jgi:hypothetical protein
MGISSRCECQIEERNRKLSGIEKSNLTGRRILLVEDDPLILMEFGSHLGGCRGRNRCRLFECQVSTGQKWRREK